jgi:hypothetical protein
MEIPRHGITSNTLPISDEALRLSSFYCVYNDLLWETVTKLESERSQHKTQSAETAESKLEFIMSSK